LNTGANSLASQLFSGQASAFNADTIASSQSNFTKQLFGLTPRQIPTRSWYEGSWLEWSVAVSGGAVQGLGKGVYNIGSGVAKTAYQVGASNLDAANDLFSTATLLTVGKEYGYRGHFSDVGQALDARQITVGGYYKDTAGTTALNTVTLGLYSQGKTGYDLYQGTITVDQASEQIGTNAVLSLLPAKALNKTRYGTAPIQNLPRMAAKDAQGLVQSALNRVGAGRGVRSAVPSAADEGLVNLASPQRTTHILYGEGLGRGGHLWPGQAGKTPFPRDWSAGRVMHEVSDIVTDPSLTWVQQTGKAGSLYTKAGDPARFIVTGTRGGVEINVIVAPAGEGIITAFPTR